jgi:uncharacterized beta-barrel protein YwiB (DUF1934 family)
MKRCVQISILGIQNAGDEPEAILTKTNGAYCFEQGLHKISYYELDENGTATDNLIFLSETEMTMIKSGSVATRFHFIPEQMRVAEYLTSFGKIVFEIETLYYHLDVNENDLNVKLKYNLFTGKKIFSENILTIQICEDRFDVEKDKAVP